MQPADSPRPVAAASAVLAAMLLIGLIDTIVIRIAGLGGLWQFHLVRAAMALPLVVVLARVLDLRLTPLAWRGVLVRSAAVSTSMVLYFGALGFMSVAEAAAGLFAAPIFILLAQTFVFRQPAGPRQVLAAAVGFTGVLLVLRPGATGTLSPALLLPLGAAAFYALGGIATRRWCGRETPASLLVAFYVCIAIWGAVGGVVLALWQPQVPPGPEGFILRGFFWPTSEFYLWTAVQAAGSVIGVGLLTRGYLLGEASFVAIFEYSVLIFAAGWGWLLWRQVPDTLAGLGMALIIASGVILVRSRGRGGMIVSRGRRYIFVHIPKTGGTALSLALEARAMKDDILIGDTPKARRRRGRLKGMQAAGRLWKHSRLRDLPGLLSDAEIADFRVFTLVRNPWDRQVSYYHWLRAQDFDHVAVTTAKQLDFPDFLADPGIRASIVGSPYGAYVIDGAGRERCDLFLRLEHLNADLPQLEAMLDLRLGPLPHANRSDRDADYRGYYDASSRDLVARMCAADIARFGYDF